MKKIFVSSVIVALSLLISCDKNLADPSEAFGESWATTEESAGGEIEGININIDSSFGQLLRFGIDAERLWYYHSSRSDELAEYGVMEIKSDFVRIGMDCSYEREEGVINPSAYDDELVMMASMRRANPDIKFFASPRPLDEAYDDDETNLYFAGVEDQTDVDAAQTGDVPWTCHPTWVWISDAYYLGAVSYNITKHARYHSDYLNFMHEQGYDIEYMDYSNEKQLYTDEELTTLNQLIISGLNEGVHIPKFIAHSSWSVDKGITFLENIETNTAVQATFDIAATHNTGGSADPATYAALAQAMGKEVWNTELHNWTGIEKQDEITNSLIFWQYIRAGFTGFSSWLFYGPYSGKDHTMLWSNSSGNVIRSIKYNIFKSVVNNVNLGNYVPSESTSSSITPTTMISEDRKKIVVALHNASDSYFKDITVRLPINYDPTEIKSTYWTSEDSRDGVSSYLDSECVDGNTFKVDLRPNSVVICVVKIEESDQMVGLEDMTEGDTAVW